MSKPLLSNVPGISRAKSAARALYSRPGPLWRETRARIQWGIWSRIGPPLAMWRRRRLDRVTFVGITGSSGKTTAKLMTTAILATAGQVREWKGTANTLPHIQHVIRSTKRSDDFCVVEMAAGEGAGGIDPQIELVQPKIGVVTSIGTEHLSAFRSIEAIAAEKGKLIEALPPDGTAVLNADDPLVLAMKDRFSGPVITYGTAADAVLRAENINAAWPHRLSFTALYNGKSCHVQTQLCGGHWVSVVLSALAVGIAAGVPLETAARAVGTVEPFMARMEPVETPDGVTFIRDDWKAPLWSMSTVFDFLETATAQRKILVIGTVSDYSGTTEASYMRVVQRALEVADFVLFVGPLAPLVLNAKQSENGDRLSVFTEARNAVDYLDGFLQPDDLVVLKGSNTADHLGRLYHSRAAPISCWRMTCGKGISCDVCPELRSHVGKVARGQTTDTALPMPALPQLEKPFQVVLGFGNPGAQYVTSPHNIGFQIVDIIAQRLDLEWAEYGDAALAHGFSDGQQILLVKPLNYVNNTGKSLLRLSEAMGFAPTDCVLAQDDIALPLGKLRTRQKGSDGGHRGVLSLILTFQSNEFRRVKVGVKPAEEQNQSEYLTSPLPAVLQPVIDAACEEAADRVLALAYAS